MAKLRSIGGPAKVDINMTPMIDVVFHLLTFFLTTFKVAAAEGDFELRLPRESVGRGVVPPQVERITIRLVAQPGGDLAQIRVDGHPPLTGRDAFLLLHERIVRVVNIARGAGQLEPEVEIDADDGLRYEYVIQTVAAISGRTDAAGTLEPLIRKIRFTPK